MALIDLTVPPGYLAPAPSLVFKPEPKDTPTMPRPYTKKTKNSRLNGDSKRVREYLKNLPKDKLANMTEAEYQTLSGHKLKSKTIFYVERKRLLDGGYASARSARLPTQRGQPSPPIGTRFTALAEIPLDKFKGSHAEVKEVVLTLVKALHPRGTEAKVVFLSDPPAMEVRVPF